MSSTEQPVLTIGICTINRDLVLIETLANLMENLPDIPCELLVADQTKDHDKATEEQLVAWQSDGKITVIRLESATLTGARNEIIKRAKSEIIVFVDDDVIISPHFFKQHLAAYKDESVAGVTGQVFQSHDPHVVPSASKPTHNTTPHFSETVRTHTKSFIGCNHSIRKNAALAIRGYDENFIASAHCEDFDMADRLVQAGYTLLYDPEAWLIHRRAVSGGCRVLDIKPRPEWTNTANLLLYAFRHGRQRHNFGLYFRRALRTGPLRRENFARPWRWPWAWFHLLRGALYGFKHRKTVTSRLHPN